MNNAYLLLPHLWRRRPAWLIQIYNSDCWRLDSHYIHIRRPNRWLSKSMNSCSYTGQSDNKIQRPHNSYISQASHFSFNYPDHQKQQPVQAIKYMQNVQTTARQANYKSYPSFHPIVKNAPINRISGVKENLETGMNRLGNHLEISRKPKNDWLYRNKRKKTEQK